MIYERQDGAGCIQQHGAGLGQLQAFPATLQQLRADDLFESPDLLAQGRLGDEHLLRGVGETARVGERYEVTQMPQLNCQRGPCYRLRQRYRVRLSLLHVRLPMQRLVIVLPTPESCLARYWDRIPGFPSLRIGNERSTPST